jgi:hypothetical protein
LGAVFTPATTTNHQVVQNHEKLDLIKDTADAANLVYVSVEKFSS